MVRCKNVHETLWIHVHQDFYKALQMLKYHGGKKKTNGSFFTCLSLSLKDIPPSNNFATSISSFVCSIKKQIHSWWCYFYLLASIACLSPQTELGILMLFIDDTTVLYHLKISLPIMSASIKDQGEEAMGTL